MLTTLHGGALHRIGEVNDTTGQFAGVICRRLGYAYGRNMHGPIIKLYDGPFSFIKARCSTSDDIDAEKCSEVLTYLNETDVMRVNYLLCHDDEGASEYHLIHKILIICFLCVSYV